MTILSVDPGKRSGWALWSPTGRLLDRGIVEIDELRVLLRHNHFKSPRVIVYEDFRLQRHRAERQSQSRMEASQVIGMLKLYGTLVDADVVAQEIEARDLGYMHSGLQPASNHDHSHDLDAIAHGFYFLETIGVKPQGVVPLDSLVSN